MTDHPSALVSVPPHALEAIAFNLCSLHDFDPAFVQQNERFAMAAITEYLRATPAPAAPQAAGVGEDELKAIARIIFPESERVKMDREWGGNRNHSRARWKKALEQAKEILALRAPSREPEGGAALDASYQAFCDGAFAVGGACEMDDPAIQHVIDQAWDEDRYMTPPTAETVECGACEGAGKIIEEARTSGANQHSACQRDCDDCDGTGRSALAAREEAPAEAGAKLAKAMWGIDLVRAQPQAREDAQPEYRCPKCGAQADERYDCCEVYAHPAPNALRVAVEALEKTRDRIQTWPIDDHETCMCGSTIKAHDIGSGHSPVSQADYAISTIVEEINKTLAALQAEQKGGAA